MIEEVVSIELPVHERMVIKKNRLTPKDYAGEPVPRISIVTGIHGDELDGQYVCYEVIRRVNNLSLIHIWQELAMQEKVLR